MIQGREYKQKRRHNLMVECRQSDEGTIKRRMETLLTTFNVSTHDIGKEGVSFDLVFWNDKSSDEFIGV